MSDSGYKVTDEAVAALTNMATDLEELAQQLHQAAELLETSFESNQGGLGRHSGSIQALIDEVKEIEEEASRPVKKLVLKLTRAAAIRAKIIANDRYSGLKGKSR